MTNTEPALPVLQVVMSGGGADPVLLTEAFWTGQTAAQPPFAQSGPAYPGTPVGAAIFAWESESLEQYRRTGGYPDLPAPDAVRQAAAQAGLRGAGGAGFPTAVKLATVAEAVGPRVVVANGEEGEPTSVKDRWLLRRRPHLVLDGLRVAAQAVAARERYVYVSDRAAAEAIAQAQDELADSAVAGVADVQIVRVAPAYVAGEETAVVRAIEGGEAKPLAKPPRPYQKGVHGRPTLVANVESLARLAVAVRPGGVRRAGSTVLVTVLHKGHAGLYEVPLGSPLSHVLDMAGATDTSPQAVLLGGFAGGIWRPDIMDAALSHDAFRARGALLGCASVVVVGSDDCPVAVAADVLSFLSGASSGQCGVCVRGTQVTAEHVIRIARGGASADALDAIDRRAESMTGRGNCALPDAASFLVHTLLRNFAPELRQHLTERCPRCQAQAPTAPSHWTRFRVLLDG